MRVKQTRLNKHSELKEFGQWDFPQSVNSQILES